MGNNKPPYNGVSLEWGAPLPSTEFLGRGDYRGVGCYPHRSFLSSALYCLHRGVMILCLSNHQKSTCAYGA